MHSNALLCVVNGPVNKELSMFLALPDCFKVISEGATGAGLTARQQSGDIMF